MPPTALTSQARRLRFLVNPAAGIRFFKKTLRLIDAAFTGPEWEAEVSVLRGPGEAGRLALLSAQENFDAVVVVGGDGTLNEAATGLLGLASPGGREALIGCRTCLGLVPHGTGNGFARGLGLPLDPAAAIVTIQAWRPRLVDAGLVRSDQGVRCFVNMLGIGFDAHVAHAANRLRPLGKLHPMLRYLGAGALSLAEYRALDLALVHDTGTLLRETFLLALANTPQYGMNAVIAPGADPSDGHFNLVVAPPMSPWQVIRDLPHLFAGREMPRLEYLSTRTLKVVHANGRRGRFHTDGEPAGELPLQVEMLKGALKVLGP